jgi:hypothetical protein
MQFKPVLLLYWVRDGLMPIDLIAPKWAPRLELSTLACVHISTHNNTRQVLQRTINWAPYILRLALLTMILNRLFYQFNVSQSNMQFQNWIKTYGQGCQFLISCSEIQVNSQNWIKQLTTIGYFRSKKGPSWSWLYGSWFTTTCASSAYHY